MSTATTTDQVDNVTLIKVDNVHINEGNQVANSKLKNSAVSHGSEMLLSAPFPMPRPACCELLSRSRSLLALAADAPPGPAQDALATMALLAAVGALEAALFEHLKAGTFQSKPGMGQMLRAAREALPWLDYRAVCAISGKRNLAAHRGEMVTRAEALEAIDVMRAQLEAWDGFSNFDNRGNDNG